MKLSSLEKEIREKVVSHFGLDRESGAGFLFLSPPEHIKADISVSWPISAAKKLKKAPVKIAEELKAVFPQEYAAEVVQPGFVNFRLPAGFLCGAVSDMLSRSDYFAKKGNERERICVEFVSANPTGPLHLASGRGATLGDSLVRIFRFLGYDAKAEYYVNNVGNQVELLGRSLRCRYKGEEPPENGYKGAYLKDIAGALGKEAENWSDSDFANAAIGGILALQKKDMENFGVSFDRWFLESELHAIGGPAKAKDALASQKMTYEKSGALWFGSSSEAEADDKDRVLVKSDGRNTYFLNDIAYHLNKYERGFTRLIDIWGADHHGYVPRMKAAVSALGFAPESFVVIIHQLVLLKRGEEAVKMSKREGEFISLKELMEEVGTDACRFFFAMRSPNTHLNFDVELAKKKSNDNPVFYVQYVHARIASIFANAREKGISFSRPDISSVSLNDEERALLLKLLWFERTLEICLKDLSPHHLTTYLTELASLFHSFYDKHKVLDQENPATTSLRLFILDGVRFVIRSGLGVLGVSAPERM